MMDIQAAIGLVELGRYESNLNRRREIFAIYNQAFENEDLIIQPTFKSDKKESSYHLYMIRVKNATEAQRDEIINRIFEQQVSVNVHFQPLPLLTAYKSRGFKMADYPMAFSKYQNEITLPVYFNLTDDNLNTITNAVINAVNSVMC